jgi:hypothetical protein
MPAAGTRTTRISWVAKAVDAIASVEKTPRASRFGRRCCSNSRVDSGRPISSRFSAL